MYNSPLFCLAHNNYSLSQIVVNKVKNIGPGVREIYPAVHTRVLKNIQAEKGRVEACELQLAI